MMNILKIYLYALSKVIPDIHTLTREEGLGIMKEQSNERKSLALITTFELPIFVLQWKAIQKTGYRKIYTNLIGS